jgi:hypothetical protein
MYFFFYSNNILFIIDDSLVNGNASVQHECETQLEKTSSSTTIELGSASHCLDANHCHQQWLMNLVVLILLIVKGH